MNKLDTQVRQSLLGYPLIFATRADVLEHMFLVVGNGYEWVGGSLVDVFDKGFDETRAREKFFFDVDRMEADFGVDASSRLARARRQFQYDNIEDLVFERGTAQPMSTTRIMAISVEHSHAFTVPDDVEESFKAGAIEVLGNLIPALYYAEKLGQDRGIRAAAQEQYRRLAPDRYEGMQALVDELMAVKYGDG